MIQAWIPVGLLYENKENNGISHFLEHMLFRGNAKIGKNKQLHNYIEALGGEMNAATSADYTEYWLSAHVKYKEKAIALFCNFLQYPLFENLEIEKKIIKEEILEELNINEEMIDCYQLTMQAFWENEIAGRPIIGTKKNIDLMEKADLQNWFEDQYKVSNINFACYGDITAQELEKYIMQTWQITTDNKQEKKQYTVGNPQVNKENQIITCDEQENQFNIQWTFALPDITRETRAGLLLLTSILDDGFASILQYEMREKHGIVYSISAQPNFIEKHALWELATNVSTGNLTLFLEKITNIFTKLQEGEIPESRFQRVKEQLLLHMDYIQDHPEEMLAKELYRQLPYVEVIKQQEIQNLEYSFITNVAKELFSTKNNVFVLVGSKASEKKELVRSYIHKWLY